MHFLFCIYFRKTRSHAVSMRSCLLLVFSFYCSFGKKKKCIIFAVHSIFLNYWTEPSSVSQVGADPEENPLMPFWDNGKISWMCWSWLNLLKNYLIFRFGNKQTECLHWGFVFSWSSVLLEFLWVQWDVCSQGFSLTFRWCELLRSRPVLPPLQFCCFFWQMHDRHSPVLSTAQKGLVISLKLLRSKPQVSSSHVNKEGLEVCIF